MELQAGGVQRPCCSPLGAENTCGGEARAARKLGEHQLPILGCYVRGFRVSALGGPGGSEWFRVWALGDFGLQGVDCKDSSVSEGGEQAAAFLMICDDNYYTLSCTLLLGSTMSHHVRLQSCVNHLSKLEGRRHPKFYTPNTRRP